MSKIASFFLGVLTSLLVIAGAAAWIFFKSAPSGEHPPVAIVAPTGPKESTPSVLREVPVKLSDEQRKVMETSGFNLRFSGTVALPPQLASSVPKDAVGSAVIVVRSADPSDSHVYSLENLQNVKLPFVYTVTVPRTYGGLFFGKEKIGPLHASVQFCYGPGAPLVCTRVTHPRLSGYSDGELVVPGGVRGDMNLQLPPVILNKKREVLNLAACFANDTRVSGTISPTPQFVSENRFSGRSALVFIPLGDDTPQASLLGNAKVTKTDFEGALKTGSVMQIVNIGSAPVPFSLKLIAGREMVQGSYYITPCGASESDLDCGTRVFPLASLTKNFFPDRKVYKLIPKDWSSPRCGRKDVVLLLHAWSNVNAATEADYAKAKSEIIEGMSF